MTISQLLKCDAKTLEGFSEAQLEEWFAPMFTVTRPEIAERKPDYNSKQSSAPNPKQNQRDNLINKAAEIAGKAGISPDIFKNLLASPTKKRK